MMRRRGRLMGGAESSTPKAPGAQQLLFNVSFKYLAVFLFAPPGVAGFCCPEQKRRIMRRQRPIQWGPCPCCQAMINCGEDRTYICILCKQRLTELFEPCRGDDPSLSSDSD